MGQVQVQARARARLCPRHQLFPLVPVILLCARAPLHAKAITRCRALTLAWLGSISTATRHLTRPSVLRGLITQTLHLLPPMTHQWPPMLAPMGDQCLPLLLLPLLPPHPRPARHGSRKLLLAQRRPALKRGWPASLTQPWISFLEIRM